MLIIGDYTARVGDPSGRDSRRPVLSPAEIDANASDLPGPGLQGARPRCSTEVRFNSEWLDMPAQELFELVGKVTVARLLERDDFSKRMAAERADLGARAALPDHAGLRLGRRPLRLELGGTDQKFNLLFARDVQRAYGVPEQSIMTMPILPGLGRGAAHEQVARATTSASPSPPEEIFGKVMSIPDSVMPLYYELLLGTSSPPTPARSRRSGQLARQLAERFHDADAAEAAEAAFDRVHVQQRGPRGRCPRPAWASSSGRW